MKMHYLDDPIVDAYLLDFLECRLPDAFAASGNRPLTIAYLGNSGRALLKRIQGSVLSRAREGSAGIAEKLEKAAIIRAAYLRKNDEAIFFRFDPNDEGRDDRLNDSDLAGMVHGRHVLLLDSSVHSGRSMRMIASRLNEADAGAVTTYGLVTKADTSFVPNYFGLMIKSDDRALFLLRHIPNNRLMPFGELRLLNERDIDRPPMPSGLDSMDRTTWSDMLYGMRAHVNRQTFVYQVGREIHGYLTVERTPNHELFLDAVASDCRQQKKGIGGYLVRWAETFARHNGCRSIALWSVENKVSWYKNRGFEETSETPIVLREGSGEERFRSMRKQIAFDRFGVIPDAPKPE